MHRGVNAQEPGETAGRSLAGSYLVLFAVAAVVLIADQISKAEVSAKLRHRTVEILGGLVRLDYTQNTGAAFSIFHNGGILFAAIAVAVSAGIVLSYRRLAGTPLLPRIALGLVLGGAIGNLIDRVRLGYVVDFVDLRWWPVFNLADSAIVAGVVLLVVNSLLVPGGTRRV